MFIKNGDDPNAKILHVMSESEMDIATEEVAEQYKKALTNIKKNELKEEDK